LHLPAESVFAPMKPLYVAPLLAQSALLNSLPIDNDLIAELQAYLESFVQLINPSIAQINQIQSNNSVLWTNLRINAQRTAGMFLYNKQQLQLNKTINNNNNLSPTSLLLTEEELTKLQSDRQQLSEYSFEELKQDLIQLVNVSRKSYVQECLYYMKHALNRFFV
jgi:hypothetical protein